MITIEQIKRLQRGARASSFTRLVLLSIEAIESIETLGARAADVPAVKAVTLEYASWAAMKLAHTPTRCDTSYECTTCGHSGSATDTPQGIELRGEIFRERCRTADTDQAASISRASGRFERLSYVARAYCAAHGADEYCAELDGAERALVTNYCLAWIASLPKALITVWAACNAADAPRFAAVLEAHGFVTAHRDWYGATNATIDEIATLADACMIGVGAYSLKHEGAL